MRLIDVDELECITYHGTEGWPDTFDDGVLWVLDEIDNSPSIDAVPVVRCRKCQKWKKTFELDNGQVFGACDRFYGAETEDSFFCRDGQ